MVEEPPGKEEDNQGKLESLEKRREAVLDELRTLLGEEQRLIAGPTTGESVDRLLEINRHEASLIDQLGAIERELSAKRGSM